MNRSGGWINIWLVVAFLFAMVLADYLGGSRLDQTAEYLLRSLR